MEQKLPKIYLSAVYFLVANHKKKDAYVLHISFPVLQKLYCYKFIVFLVLPYYSAILMVSVWTPIKHFVLAVIGSANEKDSSALLGVQIAVSSLPGNVHLLF